MSQVSVSLAEGVPEESYIEGFISAHFRGELLSQRLAAAAHPLMRWRARNGFDTRMSSSSSFASLASMSADAVRM